MMRGDLVPLFEALLLLLLPAGSKERTPLLEQILLPTAYYLPLTTYHLGAHAAPRADPRLPPLRCLPARAARPAVRHPAARAALRRRRRHGRGQARACRPRGRAPAQGAPPCTPPYTPLHTLVHPHIPLHTLTHPYTPLHTLTHPYIPSHTLTRPYALTHPFQGARVAPQAVPLARGVGRREAGAPSRGVPARGAARCRTAARRRPETRQGGGACRAHARGRGAQGARPALGAR